MGWVLDTAKLDRVRTLMAAEGVDTLVVRSPDNVCYLTNYWPMKGYDIAVVPLQGEVTLFVMEPQHEEAQRTAWTADVRAFPFYDPDDPRPPAVRAQERCLAFLAQSGGGGRIGLERSQGTQGADRMVGEPTVFWTGWFDGFDAVATDVLDAAPLLARARMIKTTQEVERLRLANELASAAMEHVRERIRPGMRESEVGAMFEGHVHELGTGYQGKVALARAFTLVWAGPGIRTFTATGARPVLEDQPTLLEIWVCADGYWSDLTKNACPGTLSRRYDELLDGLLGVYAAAIEHVRPGASLAELDTLIREGIAALGYPGQPSHPICHGVGARAHEPPFAHARQAAVIEEGMVLAIEPAVYWPEGGGLRLEDNFLVTAGGAEKLSSYPDDFRGQ
ncbi:MAG: Xaa-Pro peptidase family protein [Solirubrobacteraceae bacterium]|jgi:Xaa-Pro aminopeptidase